MRPFIREFVAICSQLDLDEPIYEFGAFQVQGQESIANMRTLFPGKSFVGTDMRYGTGVNKIMNLHSLDIPDKTVGLALCLETLEHVGNPIKAVEEMFRVLKNNGCLIITTVMNYAIHDYPSDYWRFTPACMEMLLGQFDVKLVFPIGIKNFPNSITCIAFKGDIAIKGKVLVELQAWQERSSRLV